MAPRFHLSLPGTPAEYEPQNAESMLRAGLYVHRQVLVHVGVRGTVAIQIKPCPSQMEEQIKPSPSGEERSPVRKGISLSTPIYVLYALGDTWQSQCTKQQSSSQSRHLTPSMTSTNNPG